MSFYATFIGYTHQFPVQRRALMTGQHTGHTQSQEETGKYRPKVRNCLIRKKPAQLFRNAGYTTALWKMGIGSCSEAEPNKVGFDKFFGWRLQLSDRLILLSGFGCTITINKISA